MLFFLVAVSVSSLSAVYKFWYPARKPATVDLFSGFGELGNAGIIAEYWNAYRTSGTSPLNIIATPRQQDQVRNPALVDKVFHQPALYLIKDGWFDTFPDTLTQFGRTLYKDGEMFHLGDCWLCRYRVK